MEGADIPPGPISETLHCLKPLIVHKPVFTVVDELSKEIVKPVLHPDDKKEGSRNKPKKQKGQLFYFVSYRYRPPQKSPKPCQQSPPDMVGMKAVGIAFLVNNTVNVCHTWCDSSDEIPVSWLA